MTTPTWGAGIRLCIPDSCFRYRDLSASAEDHGIDVLSGSSRVARGDP